MRLFEVVDLADMLRRVGELKADALAMPAGRKAAAVDHRDLVRHVGMRGIMRNGVDAGLRDDLAQPEFLRHGWPPLQTYRRFVKRSSTTPRSVLRLSAEAGRRRPRGQLRQSWTMRCGSRPTTSTASTGGWPIC